MAMASRLFVFSMGHIMSNEIPSAESLISAARNMIPLLREMGPRHDEEKRVSDKVAKLLRDNGFYRICQSPENGGYGMRPSVLWRVTREIARGDSATAWVLGLTGLHSWLAGFFPAQAQDDVFAGGRDAVVVALTGNVGRGVSVRLEDDHYVLDGKWTYASGIDVADWAVVLVEVEVDGRREQHLLLVPAASFRIDHDSWNVLGMRGTGSKDVYLENERVPRYRALNWQELQRLKAPGLERNRGPIYRIPHTSLFVMSVAAPVVSVAYGMLDLYLDTVKKRIPAGLRASQTEDRFSLAELGKAASQLGMAFNLLMHDVDEMYDRAVAGDEFTVDDRTRYRVDGAIIADTALSAADILVRNLGGSLLPNGPIERCFRDLHSMAAHFLLQISPAAELHGRSLLGLELPPNARY